MIIILFLIGKYRSYYVKINFIDRNCSSIYIGHRILIMHSKFKSKLILLCKYVIFSDQ